MQGLHLFISQPKRKNNLAKKQSIKTLTIFNDKITSLEAKKIVNYRGPVMYPNTAHNKKMIAAEMDSILKELRSKKK